MDLIAQWRSKRGGLRNEHAKLVKTLKKSKDKRINARADQLHEAVFGELDCLDCANCCISIPPIINETDIKRAAKFLRLRPADFKSQYIRVDEDQDMVINASPCPFLGSDNTCFIYEARPKACRAYPHTDNHEFLKNSRLHATNSYYCPAVFHILERMKL